MTEAGMLNLTIRDNHASPPRRIVWRPTYYLSKALSGCVHGLGPCGPGSNPGRETNLCSNSTKASTPVL